MIVLYTALDGRDAVVVPDFQHITLPEILRYNYAVTRVSRHPCFFTKEDLNTWTVTGMDFDDLPDQVKALIILHEL